MQKSLFLLAAVSAFAAPTQSSPSAEKLSPVALRVPRPQPRALRPAGPAYLQSARSMTTRRRDFVCNATVNFGQRCHV